MKRGFLPGHLMFPIIKIIMMIIPKQLSLQEGKSFALAQYLKHRMPIVPYPDKYSWEKMQPLRMTMECACGPNPPQATADRYSYEDQGKHGALVKAAARPRANQIAKCGEPHSPPTSPIQLRSTSSTPNSSKLPLTSSISPRGGRKERRRKCPPPPTSLPWALPSPPYSFSGASLPLHPPHSPAISPGCTTSGYVS